MPGENYLLTQEDIGQTRINTPEEQGIIEKYKAKNNRFRLLNS